MVGPCYGIGIFEGGMIPPALNEVIVLLLLRTPFLDPTIFDNYYPLSDLLFLGKIVEKMLNELMRTLEKVDYLDPF